MEFVYSDRMNGLDGSATREIFKLLSRPEIISFAGGLPANEYLPVREVDEITHEILTDKTAAKSLQYGSTEGFPAFREILTDYVKHVGITDAQVENTLVISGGQQGIDLTLKAFINAGDAVLVENPTYLAFLQIAKTYQAKVYGVKAESYGLNLQDLEDKIKKHKPKVLYCVPTFSNPTGKTYTAENRKAIASLTAKYGVIVLEDDPYGKLRFSGEQVPSLKSFDQAGNVIYITSFSKILSPGMRTGVAVGDKGVIRKLTICKQGTDLHTSNLSQLIAQKYLEKGYLFSNIEKSLPLYRTRRDCMLKALDEYMPDEFTHTVPDGGLFIWGEFDADLITKDILPEAIERDVAYIQGNEFFAVPQEGNRFIRLNFSNESPERIDRGVKALAKLYKEKIAKSR